MRRVLFSLAAGSAVLISACAMSTQDAALEVDTQTAFSAANLKAALSAEFDADAGVFKPLSPMPAPMPVAGWA